MRRAARVDANANDLFAVLLARGWFVHPTSGLAGFVDAICARKGRLELVEVKNPRGKNKVSPLQVKLHAELLESGVVVKVLRSVEDAVRL
jgi:hypothetical protein